MPWLFWVLLFIGVSIFVSWIERQVNEIRLDLEKIKGALGLNDIDIY